MGMQFDRGLPPTARVLVVDADDALYELIAEWLSAAGCEVTAKAARPDARFDLIVVDVPFPRQGGLERLRHIAAEHPATPIVALSSTFFAGIGPNGAVARTLGVAAVLPKPVKREALLAAVENLIEPAHSHPTGDGEQSR